MEEQSPFKMAKEMYDVIAHEFNSHFKHSPWRVGKPVLAHHNPNKLHATEALVTSPDYFEVVPFSKKCTKSSNLYLTNSWEWFDIIVTGEAEECRCE